MLVRSDCVKSLWWASQQLGPFMPHASYIRRKVSLFSRFCWARRYLQGQRVNNGGQEDVGVVAGKEMGENPNLSCCSIVNQGNKCLLSCYSRDEQRNGKCQSFASRKRELFFCLYWQENRKFSFMAIYSNSQASLSHRSFS